jgi:hypothetical protein
VSSNNEDPSSRPLTVRELPEEVHEALEEEAKSNFRSKSGQAVVILREWAKHRSEKQVDG